MILGIHIKAARALLEMSQLELSALTGISVPTLTKIENDKEKIEQMGKVGIGMTIAGSIACFLGLVFIVLKVKSGSIM